MNYYKLIKQQDIIGAITSNDFITYSPSIDCYLAATEKTGEYANYKNKLYRDSWMVPYQLQLPYETVTIVETSLEEYNIIIEALKEEEVIRIIDNEDEPTPPDNTDPIDELTIEYIRSSKLQELSYACRKAIESGFNWGNKHYSLTKEDQINLLNAQIAINGGETDVFYHADGEDYRLFSEEEILALVEKANNWRLENTMHLKTLKKQVEAATTIEEIAAITY